MEFNIKKCPFCNGEPRLMSTKGRYGFSRLCNALFAVRRERPIQWEKQGMTIGQKRRHQTML